MCSLHLNDDDVRAVSEAELRVASAAIAEAVKSSGYNPSDPDPAKLIDALALQRRVLTGAVEILAQHMRLLGWVA